MYEPPIKLIMGEMQTQFEENCMRAVQSYDFDVDKNELVKALEYDRNQYEKGYADGRHDAVEVVHGEWISLTECANAGVYCSVCNKKVWKEDYALCNKKNKLRSNYCPHCGAKMDEGNT